MIYILLSLVAIFVLLVLANYLWRNEFMRPEVARKFVHIIVGTFIAFWPFFMDFRTIQWLSIAMLIVVLASKYWSLFPAIHSVRRHTWGEVLFPVGVGIAALLTTSPWVFMAAVLHMGLADGLAAVMGVTFGKKTGYTVFGQYKTIVGTATFWVVSMLVTFFVVWRSDLIIVSDITLPLLLMLPLAAAVAENFSPYGSDNLWVPLLVLYFMSYASLLS
jgi:dolichol kinase